MRIAHTLRAAALVVAFAGTAHAATRWVILDAQTYTCRDAREDAAASRLPAFASPLKFRNFLREAPGVKYLGKKIIRDARGNIELVELTAQFPDKLPTTLSFFSHMSICLKVAATLPSLSDLK